MLNMMIKNLITIIIMVSCATIPQKGPVNDIKPILEGSVSLDYIKLTASEIKGFTDAQKDHIEKAISVCEITINKSDFRTNFHHLLFNPFDNNGKSNKEIHDLLASGTNNYEKDKDYTINLYLHAYRTTLPTSKAVAYTTASTQVIFLNTRVLTNRSLCSVCGTFIHEYFHNLGFGHPVKSRWGTSVPYMAGDLASEICEGLSKN